MLKTYRALYHLSTKNVHLIIQYRRTRRHNSYTFSSRLEACIPFIWTICEVYISIKFSLNSDYFPVKPVNGRNQVTKFYSPLNVATTGTLLGAPVLKKSTASFSSGLIAEKSHKKTMSKRSV